MIVGKAILWPPNKAMVPITIQANANDNSGGQVNLVATVNSNEPVKKDADWTEPKINPDGTIILNLCADRLGKGNGRTYTVIITATDSSNNQSSAKLVVKVPHDQGKN